MPAKLTGALYTYPTHALYVGPLIATSPHRHRGGQITWAPHGIDFADGDGCARRVITHVVPPYALHSHGSTSIAAVLWLDRDDVPWPRAPLSDPSLPPDLRLEPGQRIDSEGAHALADALLQRVAPTHDLGARVPRHPAVERMCALLDDNLVTSERVVGRLAQQSGLSVRQLRHRFTQELGVNPSAYLRWRRLRLAVASIERGASLTEAALAGGFADGAHFSRVFQAQFGMAPSQAFSSVRFAGTGVGSAGGPDR